jgi:hypothetical protein
MMKDHANRLLKAAAVTGLAGAALLQTASAQPTTAVAQARASWRAAIAHTAAPAAGCFHAAFPDTVWRRIECTTAPNTPYIPRTNAVGETVGNGNDYAAESASGMTGAVGSFPNVDGVRWEWDWGFNVYSIQLNSNFMSTAACNGVRGCLAWEQFVYSARSRSAFMQYWLINYGNNCPSGGWTSYSGSCYKNSNAVYVPQEAITGLQDMSLSGSAVANGNDTLVFTTATDAYSTTGKDSVVYLATDWNRSEFNLIGDGNGSKAYFNSGSSITVKLAIDDGTANAPACVGHSGTTGETNNLSLGNCSTSGGASPSIQFTESR